MYLRESKGGFGVKIAANFFLKLSDMAATVFGISSEVTGFDADAELYKISNSNGPWNTFCTTWKFPSLISFGMVKTCQGGGIFSCPYSSTRASTSGFIRLNMTFFACHIVSGGTWTLAARVRSRGF